MYGGKSFQENLSLVNEESTDFRRWTLNGECLVWYRSYNYIESVVGRGAISWVINRNLCHRHATIIGVHSCLEIKNIYT